MARTGYNIKNIQAVMDNIEKCYNDLKVTIEGEWSPLSQTMRTNWVGEDQQDFETKLAHRINQMYVSTYNMSVNAITTIYNLADAWFKFQQKNIMTMDGVADLTNAEGTVSLEQPTLTQDDKLITVNEEVIDPSADRGLVNDSSSTTIKTALEEFKTSLRNKVKEMIDAVTVDTAFFGEQSTAIKGFVEKVGSAIGEVLTAVNDIYTKLDELAGTSYDTASSDTATFVNTESTNIESSLEDLGDSRWQ